MPPIIETRNITKRFGHTLANDKINLAIEQGHIHAVLGENGAGKSTLMKILFGEEQPDEGEVIVKGGARTLTPSYAMDLGIGLIHQHFMLVREYTIPENYSLGREQKKFGFIVDYAPVKEKATKVLERLDLPMDMNTPVGNFSVEEQQIIEIGKALFRGADIIILDEPTSVLTPQKIEKLLDILRSFREEGKTIILITHKIQEALAVSDEITVLRKGQVVATLPRCEADRDILVHLMVGSDPHPGIKQETNSSVFFFRAKNLTIKDHTGRKVVEGVSFDIRDGEIFSITGIGGNGQSELVEAIIGLRALEQGEIWMGDKRIDGLSLSQRRLAGMSYVPEDRIHRGSCGGLSVLDNVIMGHHKLAEFRKGLVIDYKKSRRLTKEMIQQYDIVVNSPDALAGSLSGGNLQKVVIAREFSFDSHFMIIAYPSQGIDIRTTNFVHSEIIRRRNEGHAILLITGDLDEVLSLSDRIGVMYGGQIVKETTPFQTNRFELGQYMTGTRREQVRA